MLAVFCVCVAFATTFSCAMASQAPQEQKKGRFAVRGQQPVNGGTKVAAEPQAVDPSAGSSGSLAASPAAAAAVAAPAAAQGQASASGVPGVAPTRRAYSVSPAAAPPSFGSSTNLQQQVRLISNLKLFAHAAAIFGRLQHLGNCNMWATAIFVRLP